MSDLPLVSICVPTWNSASYLRSSLDSILSQDYPNLEVIVSDNASEDGTVAILREYERRSGIRLHVNDRNIGAGANFNLLVTLATGEFVAIYHSDDIYEPGIVSASVELLMKFPDVGLVGTMAHVIDQSGNRRYDYRLPERLAKLKKELYDLDEVMLGILDMAGDRIFMITPSIMVRRSVYAEMGLFEATAYASAGDYEFWLRVATRHRIAVIDRFLMNYRVHDKQGSQNEVRTNIRLPDGMKVVAAYQDRVSDPDIRRACLKYLDRTVLKTALKQNYARCFEESSGTLESLQGLTYAPAAFVVRMANRLGLRLGIRPSSK